MELIEHSIAWCKGEIFEARIILLSGIIILVLAFLFYKVGTTPNAKALLYPLLVAGVIFVTIGMTMSYTNPKRIKEFSESYKENPEAFVQTEKERVENFMTWYPMTRYAMTALTIIGLGMFLFWATPLGRAIGMVVIVFALAGFAIDHFSEERADIYYQKIEEAIK